MNRASLSEMMVFGMPCCLATFCMNSSATVLAVYGWLSGMKCAYLVSRSTTTRMVYFACDEGSASMKSMDMSSRRNWKGLQEAGGLAGLLLVLLASLASGDVICHIVSHPGSWIVDEGVCALGRCVPKLVSHGKDGVFAPCAQTFVRGMDIFCWNVLNLSSRE